MSLIVIETGAIQKRGCGFLFTFHSNYGAILYRLPDIATCDEFSSLSKSILFSEHIRREYTRPIVLLLFSLMTENNKLLYFDVRLDCFNRLTL